jgi:hypothetical protein
LDGASAPISRGTSIKLSKALIVVIFLARRTAPGPRRGTRRAAVAAVADRLTRPAAASTTGARASISRRRSRKRSRGLIVAVFLAHRTARRTGSQDGRPLLNGRAGMTFAPGARGFLRLPFDTLAGGRLPTLGARVGMLKRAESGPTGIASGRTGVCAKAGNSVRGRNSVHRPNKTFRPRGGAMISVPRVIGSVHSET